jgi:transposase InsO family protein
VNGKFGRRPHNPAFEVIYVYAQKEGYLNFRGSHKAIEPPQGMFAKAILKLPELPPDPKDERIYDLNPLRQKGFDFVYDAGSGIQDVGLYLAIVLDLFTRKIVGLAMRDHMRAELTIAALTMAIQWQKPPPGLTHHSDRGSQYAAAGYRKVHDATGIIQSMSRKGNC